MSSARFIDVLYLSWEFNVDLSIAAEGGILWTFKITELVAVVNKEIETKKDVSP